MFIYHSILNILSSRIEQWWHTRHLTQRHQIEPLSLYRFHFRQRFSMCKKISIFPRTEVCKKAEQQVAQFQNWMLHFLNQICRLNCTKKYFRVNLSCLFIGERQCRTFWKNYYSAMHFLRMSLAIFNSLRFDFYTHNNAIEERKVHTICMYIFYAFINMYNNLIPYG